MVKKAVFLCVLAISAPLNAGERLAMRVTPNMALEPALLTVRTIIEADADNRGLEIVAAVRGFLSEQLGSARRSQRAAPQRLRIQEPADRNVRRDERARRIHRSAGHRVACLPRRTRGWITVS